MTVRAILVGISYPGTPFALRGCRHDIERWKTYLRSRGVHDVTTLTDDVGRDAPGYPSRDRFLATLLTKVRDTRPGDFLFIHFSGHGFKTAGNTDVLTTAGSTIDAATSECLLMRHPAGTPSHNINNDNTICDRQVTQIFGLLPAGSQLLMTVDACASGNMFDLVHTAQWRAGTYHTAVRTDVPTTKGKAVVFTSTHKLPYAYDVTDKRGTVYGIFSKLFVDVLEDAHKTGRKLTVKDMLYQVQHRLDQRTNKQDPQVSMTDPALADSVMWL
jgi:hypothetical protein